MSEFAHLHVHTEYSLLDGMGRIGAILAPLIAGLLVDAGWDTPHLYYAFAVPMVIAVLSVRALTLHR